jgi:HEAT repeat protein
MSSRRKASGIIQKFAKQPSSDQDQVVAPLVELGAEAVEVLAKALEDKAYQVRVVAAVALGRLRASESVPALVAVLSDSSVNAQQAAAQALAQIGDPAVPTLLDALIGRDQSARRWAAEALGSIGDESVAQQLVQRLTDQNVEVQRAAVTALGDLKSSRAIQPLLNVLDSDNVDLARAAAEALGKIKGVVVVQPLARALGSASADVRAAAAASLQQIGRRAVAVVIRQIEEGDDVVRPVAAEILGNIGDPEAMPAPREYLGSQQAVSFAASGYEALQGADALIICTEWTKFREPDFDRIKSLLKAPVIFDGRNLYQADKMAKRGFRYFYIGQPVNAQ